jgi:hypothetical protein
MRWGGEDYGNSEEYTWNTEKMMRVSVEMKIMEESYENQRWLEISQYRVQ